ncbi:hypothetical protein N7528_005936 [Penicillium herquei]|nr:hypothetical protein N7528_005936 [Penicillium herquei]
MMPKAYKFIQIILVAVASYVIFNIVLGFLADTRWPKEIPYVSHSAIGDGTFEAIQNETLGFQHIYAIGLPERTDKRDFLSLAASMTGFKIDWLNGVRPDSLTQKAMPKGMNLSSVAPNIVACWRAHMNALVKPHYPLTGENENSRVVENSFTTALIMEDDVDWDVNIKTQLIEFARGLHTVQGNKKVQPEAPYGLNWDVLWIGGCMSGPSQNETHFYAIPNDPTVASVEQRAGAAGIPEIWKEHFPEDSTRYIYRAETGCCLYGYAVTSQGAKKILAALSVDHLEIPVDNALSDLCGGVGDRHRIACYAPSPNLFGTYRRAGPSSQDSDIESYDPGHFHEERSWNMVFSTKRNIHRLVAGEETLYSQWKEAPLPWQQADMKLGNFIYPRGLLVDL